MFSSLTISSPYHKVSCIESVRLTCGTDSPAKYIWNLKASLTDAFVQDTQKKSQVFGLNEMEEALVVLEHSSYASGTSQNWQGAWATSSSDSVRCTWGRGSAGLTHTHTHTPPPSLTDHQTRPAVTTKAKGQHFK